MSKEVATTDEATLVTLLSALAAADGSTADAIKRLHENGVEASSGQLEVLREQHRDMYQAIAQERTAAAEEAIALEFREIVVLGQKITRSWMVGVRERMENDTMDYNEKRSLPQIIQAINKTTATSTDKLLALTGRPVDGKTQDPSESTNMLLQLGVLREVPRPEIVEGDAEEVAEG